MSNEHQSNIIKRKAEARELALHLRKHRDIHFLDRFGAKYLIPELKSGKVMCYISIGNEMGTYDIIEYLLSEGRAYVPYTKDGEIECRKLIRMPKYADNYGNVKEECMGEADTPDISVTPLLAYNGERYRLGYGKGCYDRYFKKFPGIYKIGYCYSYQRLEFPHEQTDIPLDAVFTERGRAL